MSVYNYLRKCRNGRWSIYEGKYEAKSSNLFADLGCHMRDIYHNNRLLKPYRVFPWEISAMEARWTTLKLKTPARKYFGWPRPDRSVATEPSLPSCLMACLGTPWTVCASQEPPCLARSLCLSSSPRPPPPIDVAAEEREQWLSRESEMVKRTYRKVLRQRNLQEMGPGDEEWSQSWFCRF